MKVLRHGKYYDSSKGVINCDCGCKFKYDKGDILRVRDDKTLLEMYSCIKCPECGTIIQLGRFC